MTTFDEAVTAQRDNYRAREARVAARLNGMKALGSNYAEQLRRLLEMYRGILAEIDRHAGGDNAGS